VKLLNVGCGRRFHPAWTNIDLVATSPEVREYDLRRGLPYDDDTFDAVYHSHVLEHLAPADAVKMVLECRRVLKPNGILRVVVPDLEGIAKAYLQTIEQIASVGSDHTRENHRWMTLEMLDQVTRKSSGGEMKPLMRDLDLLNADFIRLRIGQEVSGNGKTGSKTFTRRVYRLIARVRQQLSIASLAFFEGPSGVAAYREGKFRQSGEIHRWMYDRMSLSELLIQTGFAGPVVCLAEDSQINLFDDYQLDRDGTLSRKPDSLYMEARKPRDLQVTCQKNTLMPTKAA